MKRIEIRLTKPTTSKAPRPQRIDAVLSASEDLARNAVDADLITHSIRMGYVYVNGKRVTSPAALIKGTEVIEFYCNPEVQKLSAALGSSKKNKPSNGTSLDGESQKNLRILYEDDALIAFDKPPRMPTHATVDTDRANLFDIAKKQTGIGTLAIHHRLDRDTSGVVLMCKMPVYNGFVSDQFAKHRLTKEYVCVVEGRLKKGSGRFETYLDEVQRRGNQRRYGSVRSGGKIAITNYLVLDQSAHFSLVEVSIETGRTHQIRVHMSESGHPIVGDTLYGADVKYFNVLRRFLLHAKSLKIEHPATHNQIHIESPVPQEFRDFLSYAKHS